MNAKTDNDGHCPLHLAAYQGHIECVEVRGSHFPFLPRYGTHFADNPNQALRFEGEEEEL